MELFFFNTLVDFVLGFKPVCVHEGYQQIYIILKRQLFHSALRYNMKVIPPIPESKKPFSLRSPCSYLLSNYPSLFHDFSSI